MPDLRGEDALSLLPKRGQPPSELMVMADQLKAIDAWGAVAIRTHIELCAGAQSQQVTVSSPNDPEAWRLLYHLLRHDCPRRLILADDAADVTHTKSPSTIILPAIPFPTVERAEDAAGAIIDTVSGHLAKPLRFLAEELPELVYTLTYAGATPTHPVACVFHDRDYGEVQLVVSDLGLRYDGDPDAGEALRTAVAGSPDGGLTSAVEVAAQRGLDASLTVAAGTGRLQWRKGTWIKASAQAIPGFTAALHEMVIFQRPDRSTLLRPKAYI